MQNHAVVLVFEPVSAIVGDTNNLGVALVSEFSPDVTVVGGGVAGLWSAKEMIDRGLRVDVIEKTDYLANGATTRNEGWLHAGTYHSAAVYDAEDARMVTERTVYGHDQIIDFAPESVEHEQSYAIFSDAESTECSGSLDRVWYSPQRNPKTAARRCGR